MARTKARTRGCVLLLALVPGSAAAQRAGQGLAEAVRLDLNRYAASGAAVVLVAGDSTILLEGFGTVRHDDGAPRVTADLPFGTVRLHDVMTALLAVRLDEIGRLDLDAPIGAYAPDLPPRMGAITLRQLLSHTAGLDDAANEPARRRPRSTTWPGATDAALFTEPGRIHSLSRHSYPLARAILRARTGRAEAGLLDELVFRPAGMSVATLDAGAASRAGAVPGHVVSTSSAQPLVALEAAANPMPQMYATARDLAALMHAWLSPSPAAPSPGTPATTFRAAGASVAPLPGHPADSVALGLEVTRNAGLRTLTYEDGEAGYGVLLRLMPEARIGVAILANATGAVLERAADAALAPLLAGRGAALATPTETSPAHTPAAAHAGTYANGDRFIVLEARGDSLYWRDGELALPVVRNGARLEAVVGDGRVAQAFDFARDAAGTAYLVVDRRAYRRQSERTR